MPLDSTSDEDTYPGQQLAQPVLTLDLACVEAAHPRMYPGAGGHHHPGGVQCVRRSLAPPGSSRDCDICEKQLDQHFASSNFHVEVSNC